jgi:hypothetical protein
MMKSLRNLLDFGESSNGVGWEYLWVIFIKEDWGFYEVRDATKMDDGDIIYERINVLI